MNFSVNSQCSVLSFSHLTIFSLTLWENMLFSGNAIPGSEHFLMTFSQLRSVMYLAVSKYPKICWHSTIILMVSKAFYNVEVWVCMTTLTEQSEAQINIKKNVKNQFHSPYLLDNIYITIFISDIYRSDQFLKHFYLGRCAGRGILLW